MKTICVLLLILLWLIISMSVIFAQQEAHSTEATVSEQSEECLGCHEVMSPGLVADWRASRHARISPEIAVEKSELERRVSNEEIPDSLKSVSVGCYECHSLNPANHRDNFEHFGYRINVVVSPYDCSTCHSIEAEQFSGSKKAHALGILQKNSLFHALVEIVNSVKNVENGNVYHLAASEGTKNET